MAFTGITATEAEIDQKTGANVSAAYTDTMKTQALLQAESILNNSTQKDWSVAYTTLNAKVKSQVTAFTSSWVATEAIAYDIDSYGDREAETKLDILKDIMDKSMKELSNKTVVQTFMNGVTG